MTAPVVERSDKCPGCLESTDHLSGWCAVCRRERYRQKHPPKPKSHPRYSVSRKKRSPDEQRQYYRETKMWSVYKLSPAGYAELLEKQAGRCAICLRKPKKNKVLAVDHDHSTGRVRGLLCGHCNIMLGMARDDPRTLRAAVDYLLEAVTALLDTGASV